jgi:hypothetical protein
MSSVTIDDLFRASLSGDREDEVAWEAVRQLHKLGSKEVLDRAIALTRSSEPLNRARGADILGQLGVSIELSTIFIPERLDSLLGLLNDESDSLVLDAAIVALGHLRQPEGIGAILKYCAHPDENVRFAVAWALPARQIDNPEIIETLLLLMRDPDSDVRDWATFGLGTQLEADTPAIRQALFERLHDMDEDTRAEAAVGLAKRKDRRVLPTLLEVLARDEYGSLYEEAASSLLGLDVVQTEGWESRRYIEELRTHFNVQDSTDFPVQ